MKANGAICREEIKTLAERFAKIICIKKAATCFGKAKKTRNKRASSLRSFFNSFCPFKLKILRRL